MQYVLEFTEEFDEEIAEILSWYSIEGEGLQEKFLQNLERAILAIQKNPFTGQIELQFRRSLEKIPIQNLL